MTIVIHGAAPVIINRVEAQMSQRDHRQQFCLHITFLASSNLPLLRERTDKLFSKELAVYTRRIEHNLSH